MPSTNPASSSLVATAARWQVNLLGGMSLASGTQTLTQLGSRPVAVLLARLALYPRRSHAREELIDLLWPGVEIDVGRNRLRQALFALRQLLEPVGDIGAPVLQVDRSALRVVDGALACDALQFEQALREGRLAQARALYRGEFMPGHYDEWVDDERMRLAALHDRLQERLEDDDFPPATDPPPAPAPAVGPEATRPPLPAYLTRLFGTDAPAARLRESVQAHRLVTLLGPGGCGKTRLAVELAHTLREPGQGFDVVAFVPLVSCQGREQMLDMLLATLRLPHGAADVAASIAEALAGRRVLLVLDNLEQLVDTGSEALGRLLALLPQLHLLATSRRALALDGEREFAIDPLALPARGQGLQATAANPGVALFIDRARAVRPDFHLGERNLGAIVDLVHELEGLPLAIELAASRVRSFAPHEMLQRLQQSRGQAAQAATPRLDLLARAGPRGGLDPRHASMHRVIAWSWAQLAPAQVRLAAALTVFRDGFTAHAAQQLWQADAEGLDPHLLLDELLSHSLLKSQASPEGTLRFEFYEPIREFASTQSGHDDPAVRRHWRARHRAWALGWARALPATAPLPEMRRELANLGMALASAASDDAPAEGVALLLALGRLLEDVELGTLALADAARCVEHCPDVLLRSRGHTALGTLLYTAGQVDAGVTHAEAGLSRLAADAPPPVRVRALLALARVRWRSRRQAETVEPLLDEAERLLQGLAGEPELGAMANAQRAFLASRLHRDHATAEALHQQALAGWQASGNQHAVNSGLYNLAVCAQDAGHHRVAIERLDRVVASVHALDDRRRLSQALNVRGNALSELRQWPAAVSAFRDSLREAWGAMAPYEVAFALWNMPRALAHVREPRRALQLAAFAERFWTTRFGALTAADHFDLRRVQRLCARQVDAVARRTEWGAGQQLELSAAIDLALRDD